MKLIVGFSRIFVGVLFIFSGLIKLNDPLGFSYKLDEYFSAAVLGLEFLQPYSLALAVILVISEVVLGVMLLLGFQRKFTVWSLALMIIFFTFLTFYSAYFEKVTDCGCFGDAIPLTPWQSFYKDLILLILIGFLLFGQKYIKPIGSRSGRTVSILGVTIACFAIAYYVLEHLPILDFRAYKAGTEISEAMQEDPNRPAVYEYEWYFTVDGEQKVITTNGSYPTGYGKHTKVETKLIDPGYVPPIHDFSMEANGKDYIDEVLQEPKALLIISYSDRTASEEGFLKLQDFLASDAAQDYSRIILLTSTPPAEFRKKVPSLPAGMEILNTDQTALKTVVRSNPGLVVLEDGVITQKVHFNDIEELQ